MTARLDAPYVAVVGASQATDQELRTAELVGALLAQGGAVVVCGGLGGVMEAACKGACLHGGRSVGILPGRDRSAANRYATVSLATGLGELRNGLVVGTCDAVIAVGGSWGTLSEIALAMRTGKPTFVIGERPVEAPGPDAEAPVSVDGAEEAVRAAFAALASADRDASADGEGTTGR
jgi:uncharacterized protein (TIGR00725 family)